MILWWIQSDRFRSEMSYCTLRRRRQLQKWQSVLRWLQPACWRESLCVMESLHVQGSESCSGSGPLQSLLLLKPQRSSGKSETKKRRFLMLHKNESRLQKKQQF